MASATALAPGREARPAPRTNPLGLVTLAALVVAWELVVRFRLLDYDFLPAPSAIAAAAADLVVAGALPADLAHTLVVTLVGWVTAAVIGIGLGLLLGLSQAAHRWSMTSFEVTKAIPPITFVPAALLVFGFSLRMELIIVVYVGVWPLLINTIGGVRGVPVELLDVARMLRFSRTQKVVKLVLPAAIPSVVVGLRLALSLCLVLAVVSEMIGNPAGLGNGLIRAQQALQPERMFAYVLTTGVLGIALNAAFRAAAGRWLSPRIADGGEVTRW